MLEPARTCFFFGFYHNQQIIYKEFYFLFQDRDGRQFISVVDLEDEGLHQDLPPRLSPGAPYGPPIQPSSPTSAQLHILATSVIRSAAVADTQSIITIPEDPPKPTTTTGLYMSFC